MNYTIRIDVYKEINLIYLASWTLPVQFNFLPVSRIASYLIIPTSPGQIFLHCPLVCGDHGQCWTKYMNNDDDEIYFCRCYSDWSGSHCTVEQKMCNCALDSICIDLMINNRSICLCPLYKSGSRCLLPSICQQNPCRNDA